MVEMPIQLLPIVTAYWYSVRLYMLYPDMVNNRNVLPRVRFSMKDIQERQGLQTEDHSQDDRDGKPVPLGKESAFGYNDPESVISESKKYIAAGLAFDQRQREEKRQ